MLESAAETAAERGRRGRWEWWRLREAARPEANASRLKPQKRRLRGVATAGEWNECRDLETVAAEEEVAENERESEECIFGGREKWKWKMVK